MSRKRKTVYQRIMRNAVMNRGMRLTPQEVWALSCDDAVMQLAENDDAWEKDPDFNPDER